MRKPSVSQRLAVSTLVGLCASALVWYATTMALPGHPSDFDQVWVAGRMAMGGTNPYEAIGPGRSFDWAWRYFYPLTASAAIAPLLALPVEWARALFMFGSAFVLAWGLTRHGWDQLPALLGAPFVISCLACQWSPVMTAALLVPGMAWVYVVKPNLGVAQFIAYPNGRALLVAVAGGVVALAVTLYVSPHWIAQWTGMSQLAFASGNSELLILEPGGAVALLALLRWRRPEARLVAALACVPLTVVSYSFLPLALVAETRMQAIVLALASWGGWILHSAVNLWDAHRGDKALVALSYVVSQVIPALWLVLRRPNEGRAMGELVPWRRAAD